MSKGETPLVVRQQERHQCALSAELRIAPEDASRVTLAPHAGVGGGLVRVTVVDCSTGGLGLQSPVFMPRTCRVLVRVTTAPGTPALEFTARVQRVWMLDRAPKYYLGVSFPGSGPAHEASVQKLIAFVAPAGEKGGARAEPR